jgi:hypothetical protein
VGNQVHVLLGETGVGQLLQTSLGRRAVGSAGMGETPGMRPRASVSVWPWHLCTRACSWAFVGILLTILGSAGHVAMQRQRVSTYLCAGVRSVGAAPWVHNPSTFSGLGDFLHAFYLFLFISGAALQLSRSLQACARPEGSTREVLRLVSFRIRGFLPHIM